MADILADIRRICAEIEPPQNRTVFIGRADARAFEQYADRHFAGAGVPSCQTIMGFPVVVSDAMPSGHIVLAARPVERIRFKPFTVDDVARVFMVPKRLIRRRSNRLAVKRWIRNEINARRLARRIGT